MSAVGTLKVPNEKRSSASRVTRNGRRITYELNVIQAPERARACGSGAKSSADRRPVDPPPIVELRIFEGEAKNDITFSYNASFFLYVTLENARNIAQGRVPPPSPATIPVLTGTPVAGIAYLDRPEPAGYFIFPDLSVRHEGKYRLTFSLFEELKDPNDADPEQAAPAAGSPATPDAYASYRCEVKSTPFTVFSAKKFPGLTESTALSRIVAEQGCRVRIRRDVRMRRRETKHKGEWDEYDEGYDHPRRASATPDAAGHTDGHESARRLSTASVHSIQPRTSDPNLHAAYHASASGFSQPPLPPATPQTPYTSQGPYGQPPAQQFQQPHQPYTPQSATSQMSSRPPTSYPSHASSYSQSQAPPASPYRSYPSQPPEFAHPSSHSRHDSWEASRSATSVPAGPSSRFGGPAPSIPSLASYTPRPLNPPTSGHAMHTSLPPLATNVASMDRYEPHSPASLTRPATSALGPPPPPSQQWEPVPVPAAYQPAQAPLPTTPTAPAPVTGKRPFANVFSSYDGRLSQGQRPDQVMHGAHGPTPGMEAATWDDPADDSGEELHYKRADGTQSLRRMPLAN